MYNLKIKVIGWVVYALILFTVLFDPTEAAFGASFLELPAFLLIMAQGLGNIIWVIGVLYVFIVAIVLAMLFSDDLFEKALETNKKDSQLKAYKVTWNTYPSVTIAFLGSTLALGSGFWFTGFFWFIAVALCQVLSSKVRKTAIFKEAITEAS